jgi:hypothetical protein
MTNDEMIAALDQALALTTAVRQTLAAPASSVVDLTPGMSVQSALEAHPAGTTFRLAPGIYDGAVTIAQSVHFIPLNPPADAPATADCPVWFTSGAPETVNILPTADGVDVLGIGVKNSNPQYQLVTVRGSHVTFDRCTLLGDPQHGQHRGWQTDGHVMTITQCFADHIWLVGSDSAVIGSWQDCDGLLVEGSYLSGGAETIMFGGADAPSADRMPKNIRITHNELTKPAGCFALGAQIKNALEVKCGLNIYVGNNILRYAGKADGQGAYSIVLTVRNQDGTAPWSTIEHVLIENNVCYWAAGGVSFLGTDDRNASSQMDDIVIRNNRFTEFDGTWGDARAVFFNQGVRNVTLEALTFDSCVNMSALGYFLNQPNQPTGLVMRNWNYTTCPTTYGWMVDGGTAVQPPAATNLVALMPDLVYDITATDPGATV